MFVDHQIYLILKIIVIIGLVILIWDKSRLIFSPRRSIFIVLFLLDALVTWVRFHSTWGFEIEMGVWLGVVVAMVAIRIAIIILPYLG